MNTWQSRRIVPAGRWLTSALLVGIVLPCGASAATSRLAVAFPPASADSDVGVVLANPAGAAVSAVVSAADRRGVLLTDALDTSVGGRETVGLFARDREPGTASVRVEAEGLLRGAIVVRDADGTTLDAQLVPGESATTLAFPVSPGTAASTAITVLNTGVAATDVRVVALAADGSVLAVQAMPALPAGATAAFATADAFPPEVREALATVQVSADQPLAGSAIAGGAAAMDVAVTTAPTRPAAALGLPVFAQGGSAMLDTAVQVFNPDTSPVTVSVQALDASGTTLEDGSTVDSVPALGSLALAGPWPANAVWIRITADRAVVAQATITSDAGGIATIPALGEEDAGAGYSLEATEDGAVLVAVPVLDGALDLVPATQRSWRLVASAPATSSGSLQARSAMQPAIAGDPCQPYTPIIVGETKSGALAVGDCRSPIYGSTIFADRYSFTGTAGQQIVVTVTGAPVRLSLVRDSDGNLLASGGFTDMSVARLPNSGSFSLPTSGTFLIEVASFSADGTGAYQVTLGSPTTPFPVGGRVTVGSSGPGLANVTMTFTRVTGSGTLPVPVTTDADGFWFQTGFAPGTTYRVTPSLATYDFRLPRQDFTQATALNFTAAFIECSAFTVTPIAVGETKSGTLAAGDCRSPVIGTTYFADRYGFAGTAGQEIVVTVAGSQGFLPNLLLVRESDRSSWGGAAGYSIARLPSSGSFTLPDTGTYFIEVSSLYPNVTGAYQVTLGSPSTLFPVGGRVTLNNTGLANVVMTFTRVAGNGALPVPVTTDADGYWFQTGFEPGTTYRVTPSLATYDFRYPRQDFTQATVLNFTAAFIECSAFAITPIAMGETKSGTLAAGDCRSPVSGTAYFADRYSFTGTVNDQIVVTAVGGKGLLLSLLLIRDYDGAWYGGGQGTVVARLPSTGSFSLPYTGTFFIEVVSLLANATGAYQVTLGSPTTSFPVAGRVTLRGAGLANVPLTFSRVTGSGALPAAVTTDADGYWFQTGFQPGTAYRVTPTLAPYVFTPVSRDFTQAAGLDFSDNVTTTSTTSSTTTSSTTTTSIRPTTTSSTSSTTTSTTAPTTTSSTTTTVTTSSTTTSSTTSSTRPSTTTSTTSSTLTTSSTTTSTIPPTTTSTTTTPTTSSTTTTTIPGCGTEATFDSIACRLEALADRVGSEVRRSSLRDRLLDVVGSALANVRLAQSETSAGRVPEARLVLENAYGDLSKFVQRLNLSRRRHLIAPGVAGPLATEGRAIRRATATLEGAL